VTISLLSSLLDLQTYQGFINLVAFLHTLGFLCVLQGKGFE